jgi:polyribonucleotide nucleotidyltransferase
MPAHRDDVKPHAPRMVKFNIDKEYIGAVIGPGGKVIQEIQRETGTTINIEEKDNQGEISIFSANQTGLERALNWVKGLVAVPVVGDTYEGTVKSIKEFGAFVEFLPKKEGLLHISEISWKRLETMDGVLKEGDVVKVKLLEVDQRTGKFKLSRKVLMPKPEGYQERSGGGPQGGGRPPGNRPSHHGDRGPREHREYREPREPREQRDQSSQPDAE